MKSKTITKKQVVTSEQGSSSTSRTSSAITTTTTPSNNNGSVTETSSNNNGGGVASHQHVTITVDGEGGSSGSVVTTSSGEGGNTSYVTYLEESSEPNSAATTIYTTTSNGHSMVYNLMEGGPAVYVSGGSSQYCDGNIPYVQDGGIYMVPSNGGGHSLDTLPSHATTTRISPTTNCTTSTSALMRRMRRKSSLVIPQMDGGLSSSSSSSSSSASEIDPNDHFLLGHSIEDGALEGLAIETFLGDGLGLLDANNSRNNQSSSSSSPGQQRGSNAPSPARRNSSVDSKFRVCPLTVQWLLENYEIAEGVSLPRSTLYSHYLQHCTDHKLEPVNAASFGKLIRSVFVGLRTRRLGTRGNSKYHYYGIRVKPGSPLVNFPEDFHHPALSTQRGFGGAAATGQASSGPAAKKFKAAKSEDALSNGIMENVSQYLGNSSTLDDFPEMDYDIPLPPGVEDNDLNVFATIYKEHCESLLDSLANFHLIQVESIWKTFWRDTSDSNYEKILPKGKLIVLCSIKAIQEFVKEVDFMLYQKLVGILLPDVLRPIPSTMTQAIRNFAKTLENWMNSALNGYPEDFISLKVSIVSSLSQTLRRYTSLNHLAQAARAVLQNQAQITQMLSDLNRVDFRNVEEQASWVCGLCSGDDIVPTLEQDFKATLGSQQSLEQWATWLENVVDRVLQPFLNTPSYIRMAKQFLLKWSFYSSLVIRDLTLRSAASFGSFHLLRLLYDEYIFYVVEHRVARVCGIVPIAVIGKKQVEPLSYSESDLNDTLSSSMNGNQLDSSVGDNVLTYTRAEQSAGTGNILKPSDMNVKRGGRRNFLST